MSNNKPVGYILDDNIYENGRKQPIKKIPILKISAGKQWDDLGEYEDIEVMTDEGDWRTIQKYELILIV